MVAVLGTVLPTFEHSPTLRYHACMNTRILDDITPYTILIDTAEKLPFAFDRPIRNVITRSKKRPTLRINARQQHLRLGSDTLLSGDYSIAGHEQPGPASVMVERKSLDDLFGTLGQERERFESKLDLLHRTYSLSAVVVESSWEEIFAAPPRYSDLNPFSVFQSVLAWQVRYPNVHWNLVGNREWAEVFTIRFLERFWREHHTGQEQTTAD